MNHYRPWSLMLFTLLLAIFLMLLPLPAWAVWLRPAWVLMVLIYWAMMLPHQINVGAAFMVGILVDVLNGTLFGEHAFAMTIAIYCITIRHRQIRMSPILQQSLWVFFIVLFYQLLLYWIQGLIGSQPKTLLYWTPALTTMLVWPWMLNMMRGHARKFKMI
jgi:rod shape-determining protein MreD